MSRAPNGYPHRGSSYGSEPTRPLRRADFGDEHDGSILPESMRLNEMLGSYQLLDFLGRGGMAIVYEAEAPDRRRVALKVLQESPFLHENVLERFRREAEAARQLGDHPNIITVYETGRVGRNHFIAMELVPGGRTLADYVQQGTHPISTILKLAIDIAGALEYAHSKGIIHRDIKPANVLLTGNDRPLLADFGLARIEMDFNRDLTLSAMSLGTPRYMAPEQAASLKAANSRSDMYSFGMILYEMLTGEPPYTITGDMGMAEVIRVVREQVPANPRKYRPGIPKPLVNVVLKLLEKDPADRYDSMADVVTDLTACRNRSQVRAAPPTFGRRADRLLFRHRRVAVVLALASGLFTVAFLWHRHALHVARHRSVAPRAEAASRALELEGLTGDDTSPGHAPPAPVRVIEEARACLLQKDGAPRAIALLTQTLDVETDSHMQRDLQRELAYAHLAAANPESALEHLAILREQFDRVREIRRLRQNAPDLRDGRYGMACFDEALARDIIPIDGHGARNLWNRALAELPPDTPHAVICRAGLERMTPEALATWAQDQKPVYAALALVLAAARTDDAAKRLLWRESARRLANPSLPWLYYYLTFHPDNQRLPSPNSTDNKEANP